MGFTRQFCFQDQLHADLQRQPGLLAAKAGASLLSPFVGRPDDINEDGMEVVRDLVAMVETYDLDARCSLPRSGTRAT